MSSQHTERLFNWKKGGGNGVIAQNDKVQTGYILTVGFTLIR